MKKFFYFSLLVFMACALYGLSNHAYFQIAHIDITAAEGSSLQRASQVKIFEAVRPSLTGSFFRVDLQAAKKAALAQEWVRDVKIDRIAPATIKIAITEYQPAARWVRDGMQAGLWDDEGRVFQAATDERLPEMDGEVADRMVMLQQYQLFASRLKPLRLQIERLQYTPRGAWSVMLENGIEVRLGKETVHARLARFVDMWPRILAQQANQLDYVDMRYPDAAAVKRRSSAPAENETAGQPENE